MKTKTSKTAYTIRYRGDNAPVYLRDAAGTAGKAEYATLADAEAGLLLAQAQEATFAPGWVPTPLEVYIGR